MVGYSTGMMNRRVTVLQRKADTQGAFGRNSGGRKYEQAGTVWAAVDFSRGTKAMREGAMDAYDRIMVRCRYTNILTRECLLLWDGKVFQIESFNADRYANTIQITAAEMPGKDAATIIETT